MSALRTLAALLIGPKCDCAEAMLGATPTANAAAARDAQAISRPRARELEASLCDSMYLPNLVREMGMRAVLARVRAPWRISPIAFCLHLSL
jgi:hypothetical protein